MARNAFLIPAFACAVCALALSGCQSGDRVGPALVSGQGGVTVWIAGGDALLDAASAPQAENDVFSAGSNRARLRAVANDVVALQLGLRGSGAVDVRVSDLAGAAGGTLSAAENVARFHVLTTRVDQFASWYPWHTGRSPVPLDVSDVLVPWHAPRGGGPARLSGDATHVVWIDIRIPPGVAAGAYRGRIELARPNSTGALRTIDLEIDVANIEIPDRRTLPVLARFDPRDLLAAHLNWPRTAAEETRLLPDVAVHAPAIALVRATMELLHEHRLTPALWASFPKFRPSDPTTVDVDWAAYDALVGPWLDGTGFADQTPLAAFPLPISDDYPSAALNGGAGSPRYERLLRAYLAACEQHFAEKQWSARAFIRLTPPRALSHEALERASWLAGIARDAGPVPLIEHLPARSLRSLGWTDAPPGDAPAIDILAPRAMWFEPAALSGRAGGRGAWFMPDEPPYAPSLRPEAPPTDAYLLPWQAYRYNAGGIWIEHAADDAGAAPTRGRRSTSGALVRSGEEFGLDHAVPTLRLKRLRRGLLDYELIRLLEARGKPLLARRTSEQLVRWAFSDAAAEALVSPRESGWTRDSAACALARNLVLDELAGGADQARNLADWGRLMSESSRIGARVRGIRLRPGPPEVQARAAVVVSNATDQPITGQWRLAAAPEAIRLRDGASVNASPGARASGMVALAAGGVAYSADGLVPLTLRFDAGAGGQIDVPARLAVATCPPAVGRTLIDGNDEDWLVAPGNSAGDFRLVRGDGNGPRAGVLGAGVDALPAARTRAHFWFDDQNLYVGIAAGLVSGQRLHYRADNSIPLDGAIPWGQDLVEIILDAASPPAATAAELFVLQIKPNGFVVGRRGALTDPPLAASTPWESGAKVAVSTRGDAWIVEAAIPLASLGPAAARAPIWGINVTRLDAARGEYSSWSGARGHAYAPETLGNLILLRPTPDDQAALRPEPE